PQYSPRHGSAEFYYQIPVRPIWKSYPIYHPDRMPAGYLEWLRQQEPQQIWNSAALQTDDDWVRAGEMVFDAAIGTNSLGTRVPRGPEYLQDRSWYERVKPPITRDGVKPFYRYIIRKKGEIEVGTLACATCHNG
ncbi:MAG: hypothetical protein JNK87_29435, partial [Bryobacterales bacterium]|nr:hypothetical protein [Bryobacterales bacterium]